MKIAILLIALVLISGCVGTETENLKCERFCKDKEMNFRYVDKPYGGAICVCEILYKNIPSENKVYKIYN